MDEQYVTIRVLVVFVLNATLICSLIIIIIIIIIWTCCVQWDWLVAWVHEKEIFKYFTRVSGERCVPTPPISKTLMQETFALR